MRLIRVLLLILGAISLINGIAMFFAPSVWFFRLVPGVPETGPFNAHLVADSGTFFIAVGIGLLIAASDPTRHVAVVIVAAVANLMHSILHLYSHAAGLLSLKHLGTEIAGIYLPTIALIAIAIILMRQGPHREAETRARSA
ncbi:MAG TPA: hypothetical protein VN867_15430 [Candidatus Binataceae bacterium]|nr:hypothetical protein [Candidatus Binataceae bacterium]